MDCKIITWRGGLSNEQSGPLREIKPPLYYRCKITSNPPPFKTSSRPSPLPFTSDLLRRTLQLTTGTQQNIDDLLDNLNKAMAKSCATYTFGSKTQSSVSGKKKENRKKATKRKANNTELRKCVIFLSLERSLLPMSTGPDIYRIPQLDHINEEETLSIFTSQTENSCLRDLLANKCFIGRAKDLVHSFCR